MRHPFLHILVVFLILGIFAWWLMNRVSVSSSIHDIFASEGETAIQPEPTPEEQEMKFMEKAIAELPEPPQEHAPQVAALLARLQALPPIPFLLEEARKRDAATPEGQDPTPWSSAELAALAEFRRNFFSAWEDFWSGPEPDWTKFPDSTLFFRQKIMSLVSEDPYKMALYNPSARVSAGSEFSPELEFILRLARQLQG
ncbi:MAG: hypothetical protein NTZ01_08130, partial [Verrucomicrobia bacterium]|nr:hypothetical protein [Verrucomicrobiota bacterium]